MPNSKNYKLSSWVIWLIIGILGLPACWLLLQSQMINGHDAASNLIMATYTDRYMGDGQWLIRWASNINFGYGYPMFTYYPPEYSLLTFVLSKITHNIVMSMNMLAVFFWFLSGMAMFYWAKEFWGERGGIVSAVAYMYMPYHIQDMYVRSAFSEFSAFAFLPFLALCLYKVSKESSFKFFLPCSFTVFLLICMHTLSLMMFMPIFVAYIIFLFIQDKNSKGILTNILIFLTGWMMSAFFWLPVAMESKYLNSSYLFSGHIDFHRNFISWKQLLHGPWTKTSDVNGISFQIGLLILILAILPLLLGRKTLFKNHLLKTHYMFWGLITLIGTFLVLPYSEYFWVHLGLSHLIQFPWRFLIIVNFSLSFLAGSLLFNFEGRTSNFVTIFVVLLLIIGSIKFFDTVHTVNVDQSAVESSLPGMLYLGEGRFTPKWIQIPPMAFPKHKFEILKGEGEIEDYRQLNSISHSATIDAVSPLLVCFHSFYYPGWKVFIDGKEGEIYPDNPFGVILFVLPAGEHDVRVFFGQTPDRRLAEMISWLGLGLLILICLGWRPLRLSSNHHRLSQKHGP